MLEFKENKLNKLFYLINYRKNNDLLIDRLAIKDFDLVNYEYIEYINDKKIVLVINRDGDSYIVSRYDYDISYTTSLKNGIKSLFPHYSLNVDLGGKFATLDEAKVFVKEFSYQISKYLNKIGYKYFILPKDREGTFYHEFQRGNHPNRYWENTSLLLDGEMMDRLKLEKFFNRVIKNYDYYGRTIIDQETWNKMKLESLNESLEIQDFILELTPWAEESLMEYNCFTINGI